MNISTVKGDLPDRQVEAIVNPWNRNLIPWWLLLPQGVSGAIKKRVDYRPFIELRKFGILLPRYSMEPEDYESSFTY